MGAAADDEEEEEARAWRRAPGEASKCSVAEECGGESGELSVAALVVVLPLDMASAAVACIWAVTNETRRGRLSGGRLCASAKRPTAEPVTQEGWSEC